MTMNFIWQQFAILPLLTEKMSCIKHGFMRGNPLLKIPTIAYSAHVSDVMYILRFIQITKPIISSRIIRFQVEQINNIVARCFYVYSEHFGRTN